MPTMLVAVDLFAGAGGLSLGLAAAGFEIKAAVELDGDAAATFRRYHPDAKVHEGDIASADYSDYTGLDLVAGGPPCQPFSVGGKRLAEGDPRNGFPQFIRAVREMQPRAFLLENVAGVLATSKRPYFDWTLRQLAALGYEVTVGSLNAADYGVPQRRQRVIAVGLHEEREFYFPEPTHGDGIRKAWRTVRSVVDPSKPSGKPNTVKITYARRPDLRPSPYDGHLFNGGGRPLDLNRPAPTLLASMGGNKTPWVDVLGIVPEYHAQLLRGDAPREGEVEGARRLTVTETALLQGFSKAMRFEGRPSSQYRQIGNAVPPLLAQRLGEALAVQLSP